MSFCLIITVAHATCAHYHPRSGASVTALSGLIGTTTKAEIRGVLGISERTGAMTTGTGYFSGSFAGIACGLPTTANVERGDVHITGARTSAAALVACAVAAQAVGVATARTTVASVLKIRHLHISVTVAPGTHGLARATALCALFCTMVTASAAVAVKYIATGYSGCYQ